MNVGMRKNIAFLRNCRLSLFLSTKGNRNIGKAKIPICFIETDKPYKKKPNFGLLSMKYKYMSKKQIARESCLRSAILSITQRLSI
jgi:hypothetical protein